MVFVACQNSKKETQEPNNKTNANKSCSCLENYQGDATFFDSAFVAEFAGDSKTTLNKGGSGKYTYYNAGWEENGVNVFLSLESFETLVEIKESYPYIFKNEQEKTLVDYVKQTYRNQSDEEIAKNSELLNEQYEKQNKNAPLDKESESAKSTLQNTLLDSEQNAYESIKSLGDYAVFNKKSNDLYVVCGEVLLQLRGQVGPWGKHDEAKGLELAIKAANKIIKQCP